MDSVVIKAFSLCIKLKACVVFTFLHAVLLVFYSILLLCPIFNNLISNSVVDLHECGHCPHNITTLKLSLKLAF